jgi:hypothetical protein
VRSGRALAFALTLALAAAFARAAAGSDDAANGYAKVRPSLVKVWAFDAQGRPFESGSGLVIVSNGARSLVLTAAHVIAGAASIRVDIDRDRHDLVAHVQQRGPRDLAVLLLDRGGLTPATFAARSLPVVEGIVIAVAGFVKHDELIGVVGQEPRLLYPGTISSRPDDGAYLELENVHVEEGLSGGPVFDPDTGDVLGIVTSRTSDQRGGFADSAALVVLPFLASSAIAFHERASTLAVAPPKPVASSKAVAALPRPLAALPKTLPVASPPPRPPVVLASLPRPTPAPSPAGPATWDAHDTTAHRIAYDHAGCAIVLSLAVQRLAFGATAADARLTLRMARRVAPVDACADIAESNASDGSYQAAATSFDGHHVTIRFRYAPGGTPSDADDALFPADVSLDADVDAMPVIAHVQLLDADWDDALDVSVSRDR